MKTSMNFEHLRATWPQLAELCAYAESYAVSDPQSAMVKMRCYIEHIVGYIYQELHLPIEPNANVHDKLINSAFEEIVDPILRSKFHFIRIQGNKAAHEGLVDQHLALQVLQEAYYISVWLYVGYGNGKQQDIVAYQSPENAPRDNESKAEYKRKNKQLQIKLAQNSAQLQQALKELEEVKQAQLAAQQEAEKLKLAIDKDKAEQLIAKTEQLKNAFEFNEAETRKRLIDAELRSDGWDVSADDSSTEEVAKEFEVDGISSATGIGYCDYVLWDDNGQPLAVIEAKRTRRDSRQGREQAKEYADALQRRFGQRPIIFYTNGYDIYLWDDAQGYAPRQIFGYYSKSSLQYLIQQRTLRKNLLETPIDVSIAGRDYQIETITRVCERFSDKHRKALIVQATGTGKTRVAIALAKRLLDAAWAKRILFLCDRKELRKQAAQAFNEYTNEPLFVKGKTSKDKQSSARIVIATYPGMMQSYQSFDVGYFDLIIADESHRSIYNKYGELFKYFDALEVGLTATPVDMISRSTSRLFGCDYKMPTANYPLEIAIEQGYLVPFKVVAHTTKFLRDGIHRDELSDEQIAELEEQGVDINTLDFDAPQIDKAIFNKDTNRAIIRNLMENGLRDADNQLPGKSIIFACNIEHANLIAELFTEMYPNLGGYFCRVIHSENERAEELIDSFKSAEGNRDDITIAVSVDMLDTGIDVPECVNLVFAKPIKSKVKFWQMIGRGTRLCHHLYGRGVHKQHFLIFDHWDNFEYFKMNPEEDEAHQGKSLAQQLFEAKVQLAVDALQKAQLPLFSQTIALIKQDIEALDDNIIAVRENWQLKVQLNDLRVLDQMAPATKEALLNSMAPLMQWRNIQGESDALRFDLDIITAERVKLLQPSALEKQLQPAMLKISTLSMHLNEVRAKAATIAQVQTPDFWNNADYADFETVRRELRAIIHLRDKGVMPSPTRAAIIDVREDVAEYRFNDVKTDIRTIDYEIYRQEVEKTLTPLFDTNPVLQKIRAGQSVSEAELNQLIAMVHTQNPNVDLATLKEFYPDSSASLDHILRTLIGMNKADIELQLTAFVQQLHTQLNSRQQRFISLLKTQLCKYGSLTVDQLYLAPFNQLDDAGLDGVFPIEQQAQIIAEFVQRYSVQLGEPQSSIAS